MAIQDGVQGRFLTLLEVSSTCSVGPLLSHDRMSEWSLDGLARRQQRRRPVSSHLSVHSCRQGNQTLESPSMIQGRRFVLGYRLWLAMMVFEGVVTDSINQLRGLEQDVCKPQHS